MLSQLSLSHQSCEEPACSLIASPCPAEPLACPVRGIDVSRLADNTSELYML